MIILLVYFLGQNSSENQNNVTNDNNKITSSNASDGFGITYCYFQLSIWRNCLVSFHSYEVDNRYWQKKHSLYSSSLLDTFCIQEVNVTYSLLENFYNQNANGRQDMWQEELREQSSDKFLDKLCEWHSKVIKKQKQIDILLWIMLLYSTPPLLLIGVGFMLQIQMFTCQIIFRGN